MGEANVVDMMLDQDACFGGEGNGGPIDPQVVLARDSFVGMAQVLDALAESDRPLSQLADQLPQFQIHKAQVSLARESVADLLELLEESFPEADANRLDGLRLDWPDRWLLVRSSNTEPIVRCIAESNDAEQSRQLCRQVEKLSLIHISEPTRPY